LAMAPGSLQQALELKWQLQQLHRLLTPMERHVLQLRLSGLSDAAIAAQLHVSRQRILQVRKRVQAKYRALSQNCASV
ncbi:helix-turn-helix domain-containing protein, partial [Lacticaseibacillus rhamnosus]